MFTGFRFPAEVITLAVRWYLHFGLSYREVKELLAHLTAPASVIRARLLVRDGPPTAPLADIESIITAYERVIAMLAQYLPIVRLDT